MPGHNETCYAPLAHAPLLVFIYNSLCFRPGRFVVIQKNAHCLAVCEHCADA